MSTPQTASKDSKNGSDKKAPPAAAAAAATDAPKPATTAPAPAATDAKTESAEVDAAEEPKERQKVYIVVGEIREFKNASEAEKFLNKDPNAPKDFTVIKGKKVEKKAKVSLR